MKNKIKVRVWDTYCKAMLTARGLDKDRVTLSDLDSAICGMLGDTTQIMLWSGLQDNKGKDIYEGDILLVEDLHGDKYHTVVKFEHGCFYSGDDSLYDDISLFKVSIIGNIFENEGLIHLTE